MKAKTGKLNQSVGSLYGKAVDMLEEGSESQRVRHGL